MIHRLFLPLVILWASQAAGESVRPVGTDVRIESYSWTAVIGDASWFQIDCTYSIDSGEPQTVSSQSRLLALPGTSVSAAVDEDWKTHWSYEADVRRLTFAWRD